MRTESDGRGTIALEVRGLAKRFHAGEPPVFREVGFRVERGERVALIGSNGTGKSTLLRCCLRLVEPDAGSVRVDGSELTALRGRALRATRARVDFVFQKHNLVPRLTVLDNVVQGGLARGKGIRAWRQSWASSAEREKAIGCLDRVGLGALATRRTGQLSGGQSQRVAVARALMQEPTMLFADEPAASLDPQAGEEVMELFSGLAAREGLTLLYVSHDLDHACRYSDRILGLKDGGLALEVSSEEADPLELRAFYG